MHDGCAGNFTDGKQVLAKIRVMGFSQGVMPMAMYITCDCGAEITMETFETKCPICGMIYAVTPCHAFDPNNIMKAGLEEE